MLHLGISTSHNATVALVRDGAVVFCQGEERIVRTKNVAGFPKATLEHIYRTLASPAAIASCAFSQRSERSYQFLKHFNFESVRYDPGFSLAQIDRWDTDRAGAEAESEGLTPPITEQSHGDARAEIARATQVAADRLVFMDHHESHMYSVLPFLPADGRDDWLILTLDGQGDGIAATASVYRDGRFERLASADDTSSLGAIYWLVTGMLGFRMNEHEYKIMGLAPYSRPEHHARLVDGLSALLWVDDQGAWRRSFGSLAELRYRLKPLVFMNRFDAVAGALQDYTERMIVRWVSHWIDRTGIRRVACAGGVFMNVKANQRIEALADVERMVLVPSAGDESTAIGAAVFGSLSHEPDRPIAPLSHLYLGWSFGEAALREAIARSGRAHQLDIETPPDINRAVAELLAADRIVARFGEPMEFGARALGNRSILANPGNPANLDLLNSAIKDRDFWMPFAPTVLDTDAPRYLATPGKTDRAAMMIAADVTPEARARLAAAIHRADGTARPQVLTRAANPGYYDLILAFKALTGIGAVLNTSFNLHGEPIVGSPGDAIDTLLRSGLRYLALGPYLIAKR